MAGWMAAMKGWGNKNSADVGETLKYVSLSIQMGCQCAWTAFFLERLYLTKFEKEHSEDGECLEKGWCCVNIPRKEKGCNVGAKVGINLHWNAAF